MTASGLHWSRKELESWTVSTLAARIAEGEALRGELHHAPRWMHEVLDGELARKRALLGVLADTRDGSVRSV